MLWLRQTNSHGHRSPVEKEGQRGCSLSEREGQRVKEQEGPRPLPGQVFIASLHTLHDNGPHLLRTGSLWVVTFTENKGEDGADYFKEKGYLQM